MTLNEDRKQTKYGHKRREHMTHTTEEWHYSPLPKGSSRALTVPSGRGGGRSGGPSGQTRTGTQDGDLQSGTDRQGPWRSWELWKPWRCRELRRPWWSWELWRPWRSWELWRPCGAGSSGGHGGAGSSGDHGGAGSPGGHGGVGSSGGHGGAGSSGGHGRWSSGAYSRNSYYPPPKISLGKWGGIRSPPGLNRQDSTKHDRKALQGQTDRTGQPTGTRSPPGLAWKLRLPLGMTSGALTGSLSNRFHIYDRGAGG